MKVTSLLETLNVVNKVLGLNIQIYPYIVGFHSRKDRLFWGKRMNIKEYKCISTAAVYANLKIQSVFYCEFTNSSLSSSTRSHSLILTLLPKQKEIEVYESMAYFKQRYKNNPRALPPNSLKSFVGIIKKKTSANQKMEIKSTYRKTKTKSERLQNKGFVQLNFFNMQVNFYLFTHCLFDFLL